MLGSISTPEKSQAARENAKRGGWPKGKKRGKRKRVALHAPLDEIGECPDCGSAACGSQ